MDFLVASLALFSLPADLGHQDWRRREAAETELRSRLWMQPLVLSAALGDDAEMRDRAWRVLWPMRELVAEVRVSDVLAAIWLPSRTAYWEDFPLRRRIVRRALASHWVRYSYYGEIDLHQTPDEALSELAAIKAYFGNYGPGWPFTK